MDKDLESGIKTLKAYLSMATNDHTILIPFYNNEIQALIDALQPTECLHPYFDVKTFYDKNCEVVKCTKCDRVIERGFSSEVRDE